MKIKIAIALLAAAAFYATGPAKKPALVGVWRTRIVESGIEVIATIHLKQSGEALLTATATPLDTHLFVVGQTEPDGRPSRTLNFEAKGNWSVMFNGLRTKFYDSNIRCGLDLDQLYGGTIVSLEPKMLVLRPNRERGDSAARIETWNR